MKNKMNTLILSILSLCTLLLVGCNNGDGGLLAPPTSPVDTIIELNVEPKQSSVPVGFSQPMQAFATFDSGKVVDVTQVAEIFWEIDDGSIAEISNAADSRGQVTTLAAGNVTITASLTSDGETFKASTTLEVTNVIVTDLVVLSESESLPAGLGQQYYAQALLSDNQVLDVTQAPVITWRSSDTTIATVSNDADTRGQVTALKEGEVTIIASGSTRGQSFESSTTLTVTDAVVSQLLVEPRVTELPIGLEQQYRATVILSDNQVLDVTQDSAISWQSSDTNIATVSNSAGTRGQVTALDVGEVTITASGTANGQTFRASATLTVTNAVVSQLIVEPANNVLPVGLEKQYTAQAVLSNGRVLDVTQDAAISWRVSDPNLATVSNSTDSKGVVKGLSVGEVTIIASGNAGGQPFEASAVLSVTNSVVTQLLIEPNQLELPVGLDKQYSAYVILSDNQVLDVTQASVISWSTSDPNIAVVSNGAETKGQVTALGVGEVTITASGTANGQAFQASATLTVTNAVVSRLIIEPENDVLPVGLEKQYTAQAVLSNGQVLDVTQDAAISWRVSDPNLATVSNSTDSKGVVKGLSVGEVTIIASGNAAGQTFEASAVLSVTNAVVTQLLVEPNQFDLPVGLDQQYSAQVILSDNQVLDVTQASAISWQSSDTNIATVSNSAATKGQVTALDVGEVTITASGTANGQAFQASATLTVSSAVVSQLIVEPSNSSLPVGLEQQYTAQAVLSNGQELDVTQDAAISWRVSDPNLAIVSNSAGSKGVVKALSVGEVTIIASGNAGGQTFEGTVTLTVTDPILEEVRLSAPEVVLLQYRDLQLRAYGHYSDGNVTEVTSFCTWNAGENLSVVGGLLSANPFIVDFTTTVSATYQGVTSSVTTVTMVEAETSPVIGRETPYISEIPSGIYSELSFQGSAVLDGVYDAKSGELLAGGYGGGLNATDQELYADNMLVNEVSYIRAIYGTAWGGSGGIPMLQVLQWQEGSVSKEIGKLYSGSSAEVGVENRVFGIIVYSSAPVQPRYVTGIQFVYK